MRINKRDIAVLVLLTTLGALPRLLSLGTTMVTDEAIWIRRGIEFGFAVKNLEFTKIPIAGHPGVTARWLSAFGAGLVHIFKGIPLYNWADNFGPFLSTEQFLFSLVSVLSIPIFYLLLKRIFDDKVAFLASAFIALDPFLIAHSRIVHVDALLFNFIFLSLLLILVFLRYDKKWALISSGVAAGLAFLTKTPALSLFPLVFLAILVRKRSLKPFLSWLVTALVVIIVLWPDLWFRPLATVSRVFGRIPYQITHTHGSDTFPPFFYPNSLVFYLTPITLFFSLLGLLILLRKIRGFGILTKETSLSHASWLVLFAFGFLTMMSVGGKKGARYILPIYPVIDAYAALAAVWILDRFTRIRPFLAKAFAGGVMLLLTFQLVSLVKLHPYYRACYNLILPKPAEAQMGWGEGLEKAADYLNGKENAQDLVVASWYLEVFKTFFKGQTRSLEVRNNPEIDYVVIYRGMFGRGEKSSVTAILEEYYPKRTPEKTIVINGLEYVWIYPAKRQ